MASARRLPLAFNVSTFGGAGQGRDYTSLQTWDGDTDIDLVTAEAGEVLDCYDDEVFDQRASFGDATADADYFRVIRAASGEEHGGTPNAGVRFFMTTESFGRGWSLQNEAFLSVYDVVLKMTINASNSDGTVTNYGGGAATGTTPRVVGVIVVDTLNSGAGVSSGIQFALNDTAKYAINCLAIRMEGHGFHVRHGVIYSCTAIENGAVGCGSQFSTDIKDCLAARG